MKELPKGARRYIAKPKGEGKARVFGVYDRAMGSWPVHRADIGPIAQDFKTEAAAQAEADRAEEAQSGV